MQPNAYWYNPARYHVPGLGVDGPDGWIVPARDGALQDTPKDRRTEIEWLVQACMGGDSDITWTVTEDGGHTLHFEC